MATGPWTIPRQLKFPGLDKFDGKIVHSMNFHDPASYTGNVLIVGMSASAQDIVSALAGHATKVYLSHRSGIAFIPRYTTNGATFDQGTNLSQTVRLATLFSWSFRRYHEYLDARIQRLSKLAYPNIPPSWNLDPAPSTAVGAPLVAAQLWPHLESGFCEIVPEVAGVCGNTVKLASGGMHGTYRGTQARPRDGTYTVLTLTQKRCTTSTTSSTAQATTRTYQSNSTHRTHIHTEAKASNLSSTKTLSPSILTRTFETHSHFSDMARSTTLVLCAGRFSAGQCLSSGKARLPCRL